MKKMYYTLSSKHPLSEEKKTYIYLKCICVFRFPLQGLCDQLPTVPRWLPVAQPGAVPASDAGLGAALLPAGPVRVPGLHPAGRLRPAEVAHTAALCALKLLLSFSGGGECEVWLTMQTVC